MTAPAKPQPLRPQWQAIPQALRDVPAWVAWRYEWRADKQGAGKWTKPPRRAVGDGYAATNNPDTWADFETARKAADHADGVGLVLTADLVGVDLDHVIGADGVIEPWAADVIERFRGAYIERSPGGDGLRIFCRGIARHSGKGGPGNRCELYGKGSPRYLTVTGHRLGEGEVIEAQAALDWLHETHMTGTKPAAPRPAAAPPVPPAAAPADAEPTDSDVLELARASAHGKRFAALFSGEAGADHSGADFALLALLAAHTRDAAQLDRLFRRSGLMRDKWDARHGTQTYGARTIAAVLEKVPLGGADLSEFLASLDRPVFDRAEAVKRARELLAPALRDREAPAYPLAALGPLAEVCEAIATHGQVQPAMAGQCVLGAASLLTQGLWNVETLAGRRPLSLDLCTLGDSGDGKSTAQGVALGPVHEWQRGAARDFAAAMADFEQAKAKRKRGDDPPEVPSCPYRLIRDATVEGLRRDLDTGPCSQGIFTDEAAAILSGYGMSAEHRSKTAGVFSGLWDSGHLSVSRATGPRVERYGRRVALHWLIQPMAAAEALGDPMLSALGFWPRFLAAWPAPLEPRKARPFKPDALPAVGAYWRRCAELLAELLPEDADDCPVIALGDDARDLLGRAFERFEVEARRGALRPVKPFALRATEQACRVAGVLAAVGGHRTIGAATARDALALVAYSLETWRAIVDEGAADPTAAHALRLYEWLTARPGWRERLSVIVKDGPACTRTKDKRDAALELLIEHKLAERVADFAQALAPEGES
jgi:hypothetical protein